ncbi:MAG: hypothetical protein ICV84_04775 [Flavisolibacter sp.]|nr:hypothetical protein [Flavisolibacter sp.]
MSLPEKNTKTYCRKACATAEKKKGRRYLAGASSAILCIGQQELIFTSWLAALSRMIKEQESFFFRYFGTDEVH